MASSSFPCSPKAVASRLESVSVLVACIPLSSPTGIHLINVQGQRNGLSLPSQVRNDAINCCAFDGPLQGTEPKLPHPLAAIAELQCLVQFPQPPHAFLDGTHNSTRGPKLVGIGSVEKLPSILKSLVNPKAKVWQKRPDYMWRFRSRPVAFPPTNVVADGISSCLAA